MCHLFSSRRRIGFTCLAVSSFGKSGVTYDFRTRQRAGHRAEGNGESVNGRTITVTNDRLDRISVKALPEVRLPDNTLVMAATTVAFSYHTNGQCAQVTQSGGVSRVVRYAYDALGRLRVKNTPEGTLTYNYDAAGAIIQISARTNYTGWAAQPPYSFESLVGTLANPNGAEWNYRYDTFSRLQKVNPDTTAVDSPADATYGYDGLGNLQTNVYRNGLVTTYTYNERNWLRMLETKVGSTTVARFDYDGAAPGGSWAGRGLSATGQRRQVRELVNGANRTVMYDYDRLRRLVAEDIDPSSSGPTGTVSYDRADPSYTWEGYDPVGNRQSRAVAGAGLITAGVTSYANHTFDALDHLNTGTTPTPVFDPNGNTTNYGAVAWFYDAENRLVKQTGSGPDVATTYDADGNRVGKVVGMVTTYYLVDDNNPTGYAQVVEEHDAAGNPTVVYVHGLSLVNERRGSAVSYYGCDGLGSVRYLSDGAVGSGTYGQVTDWYTYDAFGIQIAGTGTTPNLYRYTGEQWEADLGMYYLRARYYSPQSGRFWTMDTFNGDQEEPISLHKYLYCRADPIGGTDPTGHDEFTVAMNIEFDLAGMRPPFVDTWAPFRYKGNMTSAEQNQATDALDEARKYAHEAVQHMQGITYANVTKRYVRWFGSRDESRIQRVKETWDKIQNFLSDETITFIRTQYTGSDIAWTRHALFPHTIWLGTQFWSRPLTGYISKAGTVVHEVSHLTGRTRDIKYWKVPCLNLAITKPDKAVKNADNYAFFVELK